jgi:D-glycero-D-manno-heptose 1,7-bisphosphate phosphatase
VPDPGRRPAVFLDRDGTLNEEIGYVNHPSRFQVYPWAAEAVRELNRAGFAAVVVTNQSGVARGYFDERMVHLLHEKLRAEIEGGGGELAGIYYCPHHPQGKVEEYREACDCRKPKLGMIQRAVEDLNLDLANSFLVGDRFADIETARRAHLPSVFVLSGYGLGEYEFHRPSRPQQPWRVAENVLEAAYAIIVHGGEAHRQ